MLKEVYPVSLVTNSEAVRLARPLDGRGTGSTWHPSENLHRDTIGPSRAKARIGWANSGGRASHRVPR